MTAYVVLGQPKGGTSAVAGLLRLMGVHMGDRFGVNNHHFNHEDVELYGADLDDIERICQERHERYDKWGWKDPHLIDRWEEVEPLVPEPAPIVVLRNPEEVARSEAEWAELDYDEALQRAERRYEKLRELSARDDYHTVLFPELRNNPLLYIAELGQFVGAEVITKEMVDFVSGRYKTLSGDEVMPPHG